jgi:hypothetical protein
MLVFVAGAISGAFFTWIIVRANTARPEDIVRQSVAVVRAQTCQKLEMAYADALRNDAQTAASSLQVRLQHSDCNRRDNFGQAIPDED